MSLNTSQGRVYGHLPGRFTTDVLELLRDGILQGRSSGIANEALERRVMSRLVRTRAREDGGRASLGHH